MMGKVRLDDGNYRLPAPQGKAIHGFHCQGSRRGANLVTKETIDGQNRATISRIWGMSI